MPRVALQQIFKSADPARDKFLSRVVGIFSEQIARIWAKAPQAQYENLGRPRITRVGSRKSHTIDFTLRPRGKQRTYVAEMKCELEYQDYGYIVLTSPSQLEHHESDAFGAFLEATANPRGVRVTIQGDPVAIDGGILVWGHVSPTGRGAVMKKYGFADVLSLQDMANDLVCWDNHEYQQFLAARMSWCSELFHGLGLDGSP